jgi:hypothetical protein
MQCNVVYIALPFWFIVCVQAGLNSPIISLDDSCKQGHHDHSIAGKKISVVKQEPSTMLMESYEWTPHFHLWDRDFPIYFKNRKHPQDYQLLDAPIDPECIYHVNGGHRRLFLRVSFKCKGGFIPVTFLLDTSWPLYFRISKEAADVLQLHSVVMTDNYLGWYVNISLGECEEAPGMTVCESTNKEYEPVNFMGLAALSKLGLILHECSFEFSKKFLWF